MELIENNGVDAILEYQSRSKVFNIIIENNGGTPYVPSGAAEKIRVNLVNLGLNKFFCKDNNFSLDINSTWSDDMPRLSDYMFELGFTNEISLKDISNAITNANNELILAAGFIG